MAFAKTKSMVVLAFFMMTTMLYLIECLPPVSPIAVPLPQQDSSYSEAEMGDEMKTSDVAGADPGMTSNNKELPFSVVMEQDKTNVSHLCNPQAAADPKDCLADENCSAANEKLNPSKAEVGDQMEAPDDAGVNTERLPLRNMDEPSSSLMMEENRIHVSTDKVPLCRLQAWAEQKYSLTGDSSCRDATEGPFRNPVLLQELPENVDGEVILETSQASGSPELELLLLVIFAFIVMFIASQF